MFLQRVIRPLSILNINCFINCFIVLLIRLNEYNKIDGIFAIKYKSRCKMLYRNQVEDIQFQLFGYAVTNFPMFNSQRNGVYTIIVGLLSTS